MEVNLELIMRLTVDIAPPRHVGNHGRGDLSILPIIGGHFEGPKLNGTVCCGGADWNTRIDERFSHAYAKYWLETADGQIIDITNEGILDNENPNAVAKTVPKFQTDSNGPYAYLNSGVFVGQLEMSSQELQVIITIYQVK